MARARARTGTRRRAANRRAAKPKTATRRTLSARGRARYGKGLTRSWRTANYAYPRGTGPAKGKHPSYPIDPRHVRAALARASQRRTASSRSAIEARLRRRYGSVSNALAAARRSDAQRRGHR